MIKINRNQRDKAALELKAPQSHRLLMRNAQKQKAQKFYFREDVSTCMPGKRDAVKVGSQRLQKYILSDLISNIYTKYIMENPEEKISRATFYRCRPKNVLQVYYNNRKVCLCIHHQNMALKLRALKGIAGLPVIPDKYIKDADLRVIHNELEENLPDTPVI
jgi:hypothetical protein